MHQAKLSAVQSDSLGKRGFRSVAMIADDRATNSRQLATYLMLAPGDQLDCEQSAPAVCRDHAILQLRHLGAATRAAHHPRDAILGSALQPML
jgi:hypothetical protein